MKLYKTKNGKSLSERGAVMLVLRCLWDCYEAEPDFCFLHFKSIQRRTNLEIKDIRKICRDLRDAGCIVFMKALWNDNGEMYGSGYGIDKSVSRHAKAMLEKFEIKNEE